MSTHSITSGQIKQQALHLFHLGRGPHFVSKELNLSKNVVAKWYAIYKNEKKESWAWTDDKLYVQRQKALKLFKTGSGYKKVSGELGLAQSTVKYWQRQYKAGNLNFFVTGTRHPKQYPEQFKREILKAYRQTTLSKKAFCLICKLSVSTFNQWLKKEESSKLEAQ